MTRRIAIIITCLSIFTLASAQDVGYLLRESETLEKALKEEEALAQVMEALKLAPNDVAALSKASLLSASIGNRQADKNKKAEYVNAARTYAESALLSNGNDGAAHYAMANALDLEARLNGGKDKARALRGVKVHVDSALLLQPANSRAQHLLGNWHQQVSKLNPAEKASLKVLFGGLPDASMDQAIEWMEKARVTDPYYVLDHLDLAKAYKEIGRSEKAIDVLNRLVKLPPRTPDEAGYKAEGKKMLESLL
jgi:tetratricopeptide (TPR) repeat protein